MLSDLATLLTALAALAAVLALVVLAGRLARAGGLAPRRGTNPRLAVQEAIALDSRRRLHLVRCGEREVLLLTGGGQDLVVGWLPRTPDGDGSQP
jgi:flagellar protein FliO/FliZ